VHGRLAQAADEAPDAMIKRLSDDVLSTIKTDKQVRSGDFNHIIAVVDAKIMPNVNFQRMTSSAVGPAWREATPEQRKRLQEEFKLLLVRTYAGALSQVSDETISMKPLRGEPTDNDVRRAHRGARARRSRSSWITGSSARRARARLEDLQPQRAGRVAGRDLSAASSRRR
jgi:ABC-type transporter MlaC component